mmetsp:Transcript_23082/g.52064  ORF Transcript_23082/g.52064 Transcript_23082/m.52064 type:complete len:362 (+) Transcript_23082:674-1759(+)
MGFTRGVAAKALEDSSGDFDQALAKLLGSTGSTQPPNSAPQSPVSVTNSRPAMASGVPRSSRDHMEQSILDEMLTDITKVEWEDVVGLDYAKQTLQEAVILPYKHPELFTGLRSPTKGVLLFGPPGTGKTLLAKAVANESGFRFFSMSASSLTSKWMGDGEKLVRTLFALARESQPCVIFVDEIDSILSKRSDHEHEASRRLKTEFMVQMDGAATVSDDRVLVMGATNLPDKLDDAILRRFSKRVYVPLPNFTARLALLTQLLPVDGAVKHALGAEDMTQLGQLTDGYSCSDIVDLSKEAAMAPVRDIVQRNGPGLVKLTPENLRPLMVADFREAQRRIRPSVSLESLAYFSKWASDFAMA